MADCAVERQAILDPLPDTLSGLLLTILNHTSSEKGRSCVPPIVTAGVVSPFPLRIVVSVAGVEIEDSE
jgi:autophagy-related protein 101